MPLMQDEGMVRIQISLTDAQYIAVQRIAAERAVSIAVVLSEAVDNLAALSHGSAVDGLREISATARSALGDLAERHDDYLYGSQTVDDVW